MFVWNYNVGKYEDTSVLHRNGSKLGKVLVAYNGVLRLPSSMVCYHLTQTCQVFLMCRLAGTEICTKTLNKLSDSYLFQLVLHQPRQRTVAKSSSEKDTYV